MKVTIKLKQGYVWRYKYESDWLFALQSAAVSNRTPARSREIYVTTGNGLKMASTAAYNLWDNHRYSIANFNFN